MIAGGASAHAAHDQLHGQLGERLMQMFSAQDVADVLIPIRARSGCAIAIRGHRRGCERLELGQRCVEIDLMVEIRGLEDDLAWARLSFAVP
jgi:hypothetical protein